VSSEAGEAVGYQFGPALREQVRANLARLEPARVVAPEARAAAVGVVLLPDADGRACFVLTRRPAGLRRHAGQWALPGGRLEADETPEQAALREIDEEIGLRLGPQTMVGRLDDVLTRSGHLVMPFVVWAGPARLRANPDEVDAAYLVALDDLDAPANFFQTPLLHFRLVSSTVFAPTAAILLQFREVGLHNRQVHLGDIEQPRFAWR